MCKNNANTLQNNSISWSYNAKNKLFSKEDNANYFNISKKTGLVVVKNSFLKEKNNACYV